MPEVPNEPRGPLSAVYIVVAPCVTRLVARKLSGDCRQVPATQVGVQVFQCSVPVPVATVEPQWCHVMPVMDRFASAQLIISDDGATLAIPQSLMVTCVVAADGVVEARSPRGLTSARASGRRSEKCTLNLYHE